MIRKIAILALILSYIHHYSQKNNDSFKFGLITDSEKQMKSYQKDSTANAIVLFEEGKTVFTDYNSRFYVRTKIYKKIKIFKKEGFEHANIQIRYYVGKQMSAKVYDIKGLTHNNNYDIPLEKNNIYKTDIGDGWWEVTFTLPNIQEGSIIEYMYTIDTPFLFNFKGWEFQSSIPKIKSSFNADIPGNFTYNRSLIGSLNSSKKYCKHQEKMF